MMLKIYLCIYIITYISWYLINKIFDGRPDKYVREKVWNFIETKYGIVVPDDMKSNPVKYAIADLKDMLHKMKGCKKHKDE